MSTAEIATCAACDAPIRRGERFVLSGTEVFHKRRGCLSRIGNSILTRARLETTRQTHRANTAIQATERATQIADDMIEAGKRAVDFAEHIKQELESEKRARKAAEESALLRKETLDGMREDRARVTHELTVARARIAELEAAFKPTTSDAVGTTDDMALRFSLLELD